MLRSRALTTGMLFAATLAVGACRSSDRQQASEKAQESADKAEVLARQAEAKAGELRAKAVDRADQAADEAGKAAAEARASRDEFVARSNAKLAELDARIAELETRARASTDRTTRDALASLRQLRLDATTALENARSAGETDWSRVTATFDATYDKVAAAATEVSKKLGIVEKSK